MDDKIPMMLAEELVRRRGSYFVVKPKQIGLDKVVSGHYKKDTAVDKASGMEGVVVWAQKEEWTDGEAFRVGFERIKVNE